MNAINITKANPHLEAKYTKLTHVLHQFIAEYRLHDNAQQVTDVWTVKDILCHITYLHMFYADTLLAGKNEKLHSVYPIDFDGVASMRPYSDAALTTYLAKAHESIGTLILSGEVHTYRFIRGQKPCTLSEFMDIVIRHIADHTNELKKIRFHERSTGLL
jgi:hypothetical protein